MKKAIYILTAIITLLFSCEKSIEKTDKNLSDIINAEKIMSEAFKNRLSDTPYDIILRKTENNWIANKTLITKDKNGYSHLLKQVIENGFSDELVEGIYNSKSSTLKFNEFISIFKDNKTILENLPKDSSLYSINQLVKMLISSRNITSTDISKHLLSGIKPSDLNNEFYQNMIIIFYSSIL